MMVVGSMVGAGIFSLPRAFGSATGVFGAIVAWTIAAGGMYLLARVFQALAERKPDLDAGVYAYAKAGFGDYLGFLSALGYFASACLGNTFYWVLIKSTLGAFFPIFGEGNTLAAVAISSIGIWIFHFTVLRGVQQAAAIDKIVTVAKIVPILLFIVILAVSFNENLFAANFWGGEGMPATGLFEQVRATMLVTVFVFLGIEGASVYSRYAQKRSDVGTATIFGFIGVTCLMVLVTLLSYSVLPRAEIAGLRQPSMATVLEAVVGHWGLVFISLGLIVSVLGAHLAWQMIAAEVLFNAAKTDDMPRIFATEPQHLYEHTRAQRRHRGHHDLRRRTGARPRRRALYDLPDHSRPGRLLDRRLRHGGFLTERNLANGARHDASQSCSSSLPCQQSDDCDIRGCVDRYRNAGGVCDCSDRQQQCRSGRRPGWSV